MENIQANRAEAVKRKQEKRAEEQALEEERARDEADTAAPEKHDVQDASADRP